jgi:hypothetical protein
VQAALSKPYTYNRNNHQSYTKEDNQATILLKEARKRGLYSQKKDYWYEKNSQLTLNACDLRQKNRTTLVEKKQKLIIDGIDETLLNCIRKWINFWASLVKEARKRGFILKRKIIDTKK